MSQLRAISLPVFAASLLLAVPACGQLIPANTSATPHPLANLPPAPPTQSQPIASAPSTTRAHIEYTANRLTITADNSSLSQILGDIGQATGMKITGGVTDERVYGTYGPDTPQAVLTALLDGTSTNMLLLESHQRTVQELILTPRNGGPTPPSISPARPFDRDNTDRPEPPGGRRAGAFGGFGPGRGFHPDPSAINPNQPQLQPQPTQPPGTPPETTQQSPNGVKTPQQIYEELVRQQQKQQPATPPQE